MHELSLAQNILEVALRNARDQGFEKIHSLHLKIGRLSGVEPESLCFCFSVLSAHTIAESARVEVEKVPVRGRCRGCSTEFELQEMEFLCPSCRGNEIDLIAGTEMQLERMEVE